MSKTFIDVTDFLAWRGNFTGIQRVLYNVTKELAMNSEISLVVYDQGCYQEVKQDIDSVAAEGIHEIQRIGKKKENCKEGKSISQEVTPTGVICWSSFCNTALSPASHKCSTTKTSAT